MPVGVVLHSSVSLGTRLQLVGKNVLYILVSHTCLCLVRRISKHLPLLYTVLYSNVQITQIIMTLLVWHS